jgi:hypothetical protein
MHNSQGLTLEQARTLAFGVLAVPAIHARTTLLFVSQAGCGRICLHLLAALRAGHWRWHLAGVGREMELMLGVPALQLQRL